MVWWAVTVKTPTFTTSLNWHTAGKVGLRLRLLNLTSKPLATTCAEARLNQRAKPGQRVLNGFTLIELLVVLAIGAILVALVPPAFDRLREVSQYRDTVRALVTELRQARQQAQVYGQTVVFRVNLVDRQFGIEGRPFKSIPASIEVKTTVGQGVDQDVNSSPAIAFMREGGSTGGTLELVRQSGAGVNIKVDWLFGHITQEARVQ